MKKFNFVLDNILKFRQSIEDQEKELLARAMQKVQMEESMARKLDIEKHMHLSSYDAHTSNIGKMRQQESYMTSLDIRIKNQQKQLDKAKSVSDSIRVKVVKATSNRKILESLKDKYLTGYRQELSRAEQKILDEVGISSYNRKENR